MKNEKTFNEVMNQLFRIWEGCIVDGIDDYNYASGKILHFNDLHTVSSTIFTILC